jgi:exodeoxyribonuclease V alpha subunit
MKTEGDFSALDRQFGDLIARLAGGSAPEAQLAAMCASRARGQGHICVSLGEIAAAGPATRAAAALRKNLRASKVVGAPGAFTPLVLDDHDRLYLRRYWEYEQQLAAAILGRAGAQDAQPAPNDETHLQKVAAEKAVTNFFTVITGGPGTGKTRTVMRILQLLLEQPGGEKLRVALAAPTGKAAARLTEGARTVRESYEATTIHRLLGYLPGSPYFRHNADRLLNANLVIVDEASMIDLALMAKLMAAVPNDARLVLLGDRDQLASVEAGSVLADICAAAEAAAPGQPLHGTVVALRQNYRFAETGGIYRVSSAINSGAVEAALAALQEKAQSEIEWQPLPVATRLVPALRERIVAGFRGYLEVAEPREALLRLQQFRVLGALRHGPFGVKNLNAIAEEILADAGLLVARRGWYRGQPLMITQNDYNLSLFNGDSGIILPDPLSGGELRAFFLSGDGRVRRFLPSRLPAHETAFAITVHKSQGSEFERLLFILPEKDNPLLTRELLYTAITRARQAVTLWSNEAILRAAISRRTIRHSGLRETLVSRSAIRKDFSS